MKNKKTFKVVMLPSNEKINGGLDLNNNKLSIESNLFTRYNPQHIYIVSNDKTKKDGYLIWHDQVKQCINVNAIDECPTIDINGTLIEVGGFPNIVATTDKSILEAYSKDMSKEDFFPRLPESFIQTYIKAYNEGKPIIEVDLEVECGCNGNPHKMGCPVQDNSYLFPKTRPDNTVIIHPSKTYSREEMLDFGLKCGIAGTLSERTKQDFNQLYLELVQKYL